MKNYLKDSYRTRARYNARANRELYTAVSTLTDKGRRRDTGSWFGSIYGCLNHIVVADLFWLNRFKPIFPQSTVLADPALSPSNLSWQHNLHDSFDELAQTRRAVDEKIVAWFEECPEERYGAAFEYRDSAGAARPAIAWKAFEFLFLHQIHHRGQISQMLDELGLPNNMADNGPFLEGAD